MFAVVAVTQVPFSVRVPLEVVHVQSEIIADELANSQETRTWLAAMRELLKLTKLPVVAEHATDVR